MSADVSTLVASLRSADPAARQSAAEQLAQMESEAQPAAVALVEMCGAENEELREAVVSALEAIGPPQASDVAQLAALLKDSRLDVAYWASTLLGRLGAEGVPAVPGLTEAVSRHGEPAVRQRAVWALGQIGPGAKSSLDTLQSATSSSDARLAALARDAIAQIKS